MTDNEVDYWINTLQDEDLVVRWRVIQAFATLGRTLHNPMPVISELASLFNDQGLHWKIRKRGVEALGALVNNLEDPIVVLPTIQEVLQAKDWKVREQLVWELEPLLYNLTDPTPLMHILLPIAEDEDFWVREVVMRSFGALINRLEDSGPLITLLVGALGDESWAVQEVAAQILAKLGDLRVIPHYLEMLTHEASIVRAKATVMLGELRDLRAVESLIQTLQDEQEHVRKAGVEALKKIEEPAVAVLLTSLQDDDSFVRKLAAEALDKLDWIPNDMIGQVSYLIAKQAWNELIDIGKPAVNTLCQALQDTDVNIRKATVLALGQIGDTRALAPLIQALQDEHSEVRKISACALGSLKDEQPVEPLLQSLQDSKYQVQQASAEILGKVKDTRALDGLVHALRDSEYSVRLAATKTLGKLGNERAVNPLISVLQDDKWSFIRCAAATSLGQLGDKKAVEPLRQTLQEGYWTVRVAAVKALYTLGWEPGNPMEQIHALIVAEKWEEVVSFRGLAVSTLLQVLQYQHSKKDIIEVLARIGQPAVPQLLQLLTYGDLDNETLIAVVKALGRIGDVRAMTPLLEIILNVDEKWSESSNWDLFIAAKTALKAIDWKEGDITEQILYLVVIGEAKELIHFGKAAITPLLQALESEDSGIQIFAIKMLGQLGDTRVVPPLYDMVMNEEVNTEVQDAAAKVLIAFGDERAVKPMIQMLKANRSSMRRDAAQALGELGDAKAVSALTQALKDRNLDVQKAAQEALAKLQDSKPEV